MKVPDDLFEKILGHGPCAGFIGDALERMKEEGRLNEVVQQCIRFLDLYPDDVRLRMLLAHSYAEMGFVSLAGNEFEKAAAVIDDLAAAYRLLAETYERQQRYDEAADALKRYLAHHPNDADAIEHLERIQTDWMSEEMPDEGDLMRNLGHLEDLSADELVDFATPTIAELYYAQGRVDAAVQTYEKVLRDRPGDEGSVERLRELKEMLRESKAAGEATGSAVNWKKEKMIAILEHWLPTIREIRHA